MIRSLTDYRRVATPWDKPATRLTRGEAEIEVSSFPCHSPEQNPYEGAQQRPEAGSDLLGIDTQQGMAERRRSRAHAQAVEAAGSSAWLFRTQRLPLCCVAQSHPGRINHTPAP
jgi:hypothetical protein